MKRKRPLRRMTVVLASTCIALLGLFISLDGDRVSAQSNDDSTSLRAFSVVASVLTSPRCLNCHIPGDSPLQGDSGMPHNVNVKRGPDGRGTPTMRCTNCHQDEN